MNRLSCVYVWMTVVACLIAPCWSRAEFPSLTAGSAEQNMESLDAITTLPDGRTYVVVAEQTPRPLTIEDLSSKQAAQGTAWFSEGSFFLRLGEEGLTAYNREFHSAMKEFFDEIVTQSQAMSSATYQMTGSVQKKDVRGGGWELVVVADDISLHEKLAELADNSIALISPVDPKAIAQAQEGDSVGLLVHAYGLLDAYGSKLPSKQTSEDISVQAVFGEDENVVARATAKVNQYSGILTTYRPSRTTVVAGWAMKADHDARRKRFTFVLGRSGETPATLMPQPITEGTTVRYEALDGEAYKQQLAEKKAARAEQRAAARAEADKERKEAVQEQKRQYYEKKSADREKAIEENKPREEHWKGMALLVRILTGVAVVVYVFSLVRVMRSPGGADQTQLSSLVRSMIAVVWMGYFLAEAAVKWGSVDAPIIDTWFLCGVGGVVGMLLLPWFRGAFRRTREQKMRDAVHDAVSEAVGGWGWIIRPIAQYVLAPILVGGLFCPVIWAGTVVNAPVSLLRLRGQEAGDVEHPSDADEEGME